MGLVASNHPFLLIKRLKTFEPTKEDFESAVKVYTSKVLHGTLNPSWDLGEIKLDLLCNSDIDMPLVWEIWSFQKNGSHRIYGRVIGSIRQMLDRETQNLDIIKKQGMPYGSMTFSQFQLIEKPTMMEYFRSGWIVSLSVAIDFTASNGELSDPNSLHYVNPKNPVKLTPYEEAIHRVGNILEPYDSDRKFPVFGFGAKPRY